MYMFYFLSVYPLLTTSLNKTGRPIVFSCSWPAYQVDKGMKVRRLIIIQNIRGHNYQQKCFDSHVIEFGGFFSLFSRENNSSFVPGGHIRLCVHLYTVCVCNIHTNYICFPYLQKYPIYFMQCASHIFQNTSKTIYLKI